MRIDGVAAAAGPGLIGGVIVGLTTAKAIALVKNKPLIAVNHLEAHALTARLTDGDRISLLPVSRLRRPYPDRGRARRRRLCAAWHDAGRRHRRGLRQDREASWSRLSGRAAGREGSGCAATPTRFALPRPMHGRKDRRFFALRTEDRIAAGSGKDRPAQRSGCRRSLRRVSSRRSSTSCSTGCGPGWCFSARASEHRARWLPPAALPRTRRSARCSTASPSRSAPALVVPPPELCTDNGAMIAWAGCERLALGLDRSA